MLAERRLHRMQLVAVREALDGEDLGAVGRRGEHRAGLHRDAVHVHDAGAALRRVAADMRAGQAEMVAQELHEQRAVLDLPRYGPPVHGDGHIRHQVLPFHDLLAACAAFTLL